LADLLGHSDVSVTKAFYGIFTREELREKHARHSPISQLVGGKEDDGR
jgi:site-specific recombinase XerD